LAALASALALPLCARTGETLRATVPPLRLLLDGSDSSRQIGAALQRRYPSAVTALDAQVWAGSDAPAVYLTAGPTGLEAALEAGLNGPLISLFVASTAYMRALRAAARVSKHPVTAIHAEASPLSQMMLIRQLYARSVTVGALLGPATADLEPELRQAARTAGLEIAVHRIAAADNPVRELAALSGVQVLLTVPDPDIYSSQNLRPLLESTYRRGQGAIGFSTAMVRAGTLAAAYAGIDDVIAQVGSVADALLDGKTVPPQHPLYWRVMINDTVARSLNLIVDSSVRALGNLPP
jgi:putative tryptophan/tyrosine transport system substrate-binding protein